MKKLILSFLFASLLFMPSLTFAKENVDREQAKKELTELVDEAGKKISKGVESAGKSIKKGVESAGDKAKSDTAEKAKSKTKEKAGEIGSKISDAIKSGVKKTEETLNTHSTKFLTGTMHVKGSGKKARATFKADDGTTYPIKTISGSEDSMLKLSAYNKKRVKISGVLNTESKVITLATYKLANEDDD